jgi:hypothetical protein
MSKQNIKRKVHVGWNISKKNDKRKLRPDPDLKLFASSVVTENNCFGFIIDNRPTFQPYITLSKNKCPKKLLGCG